MQSQLTAVSKRLVSLSLPQISCALCAVSQSLSCISRALWAVSKSFVSQYLSLSLSCSPARRLTSSLLSSQRCCNVASLYAALVSTVHNSLKVTLSSSASGAVLLVVQAFGGTPLLSFTLLFVLIKCATTHFVLLFTFSWQSGAAGLLASTLLSFSVLSASFCDRHHLGRREGDDDIYGRNRIYFQSDIMV